MIKYRLSVYGYDIIQVSAKERPGWGFLYWDTWEQAHDYLADLVDSRIRKAQSELDRAKADKATIAAMKKPETPDAT